MYKISVPVMNSNVKRNNRERLLKELNRLDATRVFLALDQYETDKVKKEIALKELADNCKFFQDNGYEVGAWIWTFWIPDNPGFRNMRSITGKEIKVTNVERRAGDPPVLVGSSEKASKVLGWTPKYGDIKIILEHAWNWQCNKRY